MTREEAIAKFKVIEMLPPGLEYTVHEILVGYLYHRNLESDIKPQLVRSILQTASLLRFITPNEAAYFMTHLDEGLETIRDRFWESLK